MQKENRLIWRESKVRDPEWQILAFDKSPNNNSFCHRGGYEKESDARNTPALRAYQTIILIGRDGTKEILKGNIFEHTEILDRIIPNWGREENAVA